MNGDAEAVALGAHLRRLRMSRGLSLRQAVEAANSNGVDWNHRQVLSKIEHGHRQLRATELRALALAYEVGTADLLPPASTA